MMSLSAMRSVCLRHDTADGAGESFSDRAGIIMGRRIPVGIRSSDTSSKSGNFTLAKAVMGGYRFNTYDVTHQFHLGHGTKVAH